MTLRELHALEVYDSVLRPFDLNHCLTARFFRSESGLRSFVRPRQRRLRAPGCSATRGRSNSAWHGRSECPPPLVPEQLERLGITEREAHVLDHVARGRSNAEIASELSVAPGTVKKHLDNIFEKLGSSQSGRSDAYLDLFVVKSERGGSRALALACGRPGRLVQPARRELALLDPQVARELAIGRRVPPRRGSAAARRSPCEVCVDRPRVGRECKVHRDAVGKTEVLGGLDKEAPVLNLEHEGHIDLGEFIRLAKRFKDAQD